MKSNPRSSSTEIKVGAALSYATIILTNLVGIMLTPLTIRMLGDSEYGLYILIGAFVGYMTVLDFGLNNTVIRFIAKYRVESDKKGEERFLATVMMIYVVIGAVIVLIGSGCYLNFNAIFTKSLTPQELAKAKMMFAILVFNVAVTLPGGAFTAICNGYEQFVFPRAVNVARYLVRSAIVVCILLLGGKAISMVVLDTVMNLIVILITMYYVFNKIKVRISFSCTDRQLVKKILNYSIWVFVFAIVGQFQWRSGQVVLGILSGTTTVAIYGTGVALGTYYGAFSTAVSGLFLPRATKMVAGNSDSEELTSMMIKIGRISLLLLLYILGAFFLFGRDFIHLWVGDRYADSWLVALLIMVGYTTPLVQSFANSILEARALLSFKATLYLSMTAIGTIFGALLVKPYGVAGMVFGSIAAWLLSQIVMNIYFHTVLRLNVVRFFRELLAKTVLSFSVVLLFCSVIRIHDNASWLHFAVNCLIYSIVYGSLMFFFAMNPYERSIVQGMFQKFGVTGRRVLCR